MNKSDFFLSPLGGDLDVNKILKYIWTIFFLYLLLSIAFQTLGAIFAKYASQSLQDPNILSINSAPVLIIAFFLCMGFQALVWQKSLEFYPLSFAYPIRSLVNFTVLFSSFILFNESITLANIIALCIISAGIFFLVHEGE